MRRQHISGGPPSMSSGFHRVERAKRDLVENKVCCRAWCGSGIMFAYAALKFSWQRVGQKGANCVNALRLKCEVDVVREVIADLREALQRWRNLQRDFLIIAASIVWCGDYASGRRTAAMMQQSNL